MYTTRHSVSLSKRLSWTFSISLILMLLAATLTGCVPVESTQQAQLPSASSDTPPSAIGGPMSIREPIFVGEEASSLAEAQSRVGFEIGVPRVLPDNFKLIWRGTSPLSAKEEGGGFSRLVYSDGEHHIIVGQRLSEFDALEVELTDEWLAEFDQQKVTIQGHPGIGHERTEREMPIAVFEGKLVKVPVQETASVRWWPPGLMLQVWTPDDMSITLADLIAIAESVELVQ